MNKINYDKVMNDIINENLSRKERPTLLLHSCCAPCSSACLERLVEFFDVTVYYYNPNLDGIEEYIKRSSEQERLCKELGVKLMVESFDDASLYHEVVKGMEDSKEGGARCEKCFSLRLDKTAEKAKKEGFSYFATTLTVSPLKNAQLINRIGYEIQSQRQIKYLPSDFKKQGGYLRSIELSKKYRLYRQNYCGCQFSKRI